MAITISDVASHSGVSIKTVSRVINNEPRVKEATREKVLASIKSLGYVTNLTAKRLASGRSFTIGLLFHNASWHYVSDVHQVVLETALESHYSTVLFPFNITSPYTAQGVFDLVTQRVVDGFVFTPPTDNVRSLLKDLHTAGIPFVRLSPTDRETPWQYVTATDYKGAFEMTRYLLSIGHRRIGYILGPDVQKAAHDRFAGYKAALKEFQLDFGSYYIRQGDDHFESGIAAARDLLRMEDRVTAIFSNNDEMAAGAVFAAHQLGLNIPGDVSIAGFDDIPLSRQIWPPLTTVRQPIYQMARYATQLLIEILQGGQPGILRYEIPTELVIRGSTRSL